MRWLFVFALLFAGCEPNARPPATPTPPEGPAKLAAAEREILAALAIVDGRLELRFGLRAADADLHRAATELILSEDPSAALIEGRIDVFSFGARERALGKLKDRVPAGNLPADAALERELLLRLIDGEQSRVTQEKALPSAASELVRGIVATWQPASDEASLGSRDVWLKRRLDEIEDSLATPLPRDEQYELEDALDPLEAKIAGYKESLPALAKLRVALGRAQPASPIGWPALSKRLAPQLGDVPAAEVLMKRFEMLEHALHPPQTPADAADQLVKKLLLGPAARCALEGRDSVVRSLGAPPERDLTCRIVGAIAKDDPSAPLAMHRIVVLAMETLAAHSGVKSPVDVRVVAGLSSRAGGRPVEFIVAALAVEWIHAGTNARQRASKWARFGDAPLDVAFRELAK